ncbi:ferredoxin [Candidatus Palauibacter irciniicola]|uniref:ferredoxin n=1 Tax=Candidatus Palauibacter irciniicola TaxID=3056733 RepID=UPI003B01EEDF
MVRIEVDHGLCVGNAMCVATAPGVFAHNENRQSTVVDAAGDPEALVLEAAANCPVSAIRVVDGRDGPDAVSARAGRGKLNRG